MAENYSGLPHSQGSSPHSDNESGGHYSGGHDHNVREQDRLLPIANVGRIMKRALPSNGKISKDAKETVQECVSEFISFITGEASDKCQREKRKTINGDDLLWAMGTLGFEEYIDPLKAYLQKYRELEGEKVSGPKQGEHQGGREGGGGHADTNGGLPVSMQAQAYGMLPPNMVYGQPAMPPYHGTGSGSFGSSGGAGGRHL